MSKLKELKEQRASLFDEVQNLAKLEELTDEQRSTFNTKADELEELDKQIATEERREHIAAMTAEAIEEDADKQGRSTEDVKKQYELAFRSYVMNQLTPEQREILKRANKQNTTAANGGYTIPEGFSGLLEKAMLYYTPFNEDLVTIWRTANGNTVDWPTTNDTGNKAYLIAEGADSTTGATAAPFGNIQFGAYKLTSGMLQVSYELLADSYFNMETVLAELFGERMGRGISHYCTNGTGTGEPQGVVVGATLGVTAAAAAAITRDDIVNLIHSVDPEYRKNGTLMFNDATLAAIKKLAFGTADDRPLYQVSPIVGEPDKIEGFPFVVNNDMSDIGTGNTSMLFGDFKKFVIRYAGEDRMRVSYERFVETDEVGMVMFKRIDSKVLDAGTHPIKSLVHP